MPDRVVGIDQAQEALRLQVPQVLLVRRDRAFLPPLQELLQITSLLI